MQALFALLIPQNETPAISKSITHNGLRRVSQTDLDTIFAVPSTGGCTSPTCPIQFPHKAGRYHHPGLRPARDEYSYPFGTSNTPLEIYAAWQRVLIARTPWHPPAIAQAQWLSAEELREDQKAVAGYIRLHAGAYYGPEDFKADGGFLRLDVPKRASCGLEDIGIESTEKSESRIWISEDCFSDDDDLESPTSASRFMEKEIDYPENELESESPKSERKPKWERAWNMKPEQEQEGFQEEKSKINDEEEHLSCPPSEIEEDEAASLTSESDSSDEEVEIQFQSEGQVINDIFAPVCRYFPCTCGEFPLYCERYLDVLEDSPNGRRLSDLEDFSTEQICVPREETVSQTSSRRKGKKPDTSVQRKGTISASSSERSQESSTSSSERSQASSASSIETEEELYASRVKVHDDVFYEESFFSS